MRRIGLTVVLTALGVALIGGAAVSLFPVALIGLDPYIGTHASVAEAALGCGLCLAAVNPAAHLSWIRIAIVYAILTVAYELVLYFYLGVPLAPMPLGIGLVAGLLLILLYPNRGDLLPKSPRTPAAAAAFPGSNPGAAKA